MKTTLFQNEQLIRFLIFISTVCAVATLILLQLYNTTSSLPPDTSNHISHILTQTQMVSTLRINRIQYPVSNSCC